MDLVEHHPLFGAGGQMVGKRLEDLLVNRGIFYRGVGEDEGVGVFKLLGIFWRVCNQILVFIAIELVEVSTMAAAVLRHNR